MSECPKNDSGHEPLHRLVGEAAKVDVGAEYGRVDAMFRFEAPADFEGPTGFVHACKHCHLLYFEPDAAEGGES